jgi:hypothetical protein
MSDGDHLTQPRLDPAHCAECAWLAEPDTARWAELHHMIALMLEARPSKMRDHHPPAEEAS